MSELKCQEEYEQESFRDLLSLTKNMDIEPKRNQLCYCMSGKKYKKCCMEKEKEPVSNLVKLKGFYLVPDTDPRVFQCGMTDEDYNIAADCYDVILTGELEEDPEAVELLTTLLEKYPSHSALNSVQALGCLMKGEECAFEDAIKRNLEKFPDSKMNQLLLKYHEYESYAKRFFPSFGKDVKDLPPESPELHDTSDEQVPLTEFLFALSLQIYEALFQERLTRAIDLLDMMTEVLERMDWDDHFLLLRTEQLVVFAKFIRRIRILLANDSEERASEHDAVLINT